MDNEYYLPSIVALKRQAEIAGHRRLLVLSGERKWATGLALAALSELGIVSALWLTDQSLTAENGLDVEYSLAKKAMRHLGSERKLVVLDSYAGFHPDGFGAISGVLQAGGLFILLTPSADCWPDYDDPDYERITSLPFARSELKRRFISRISRAILSSDSVLHLCEGEPLQRDGVTSSDTLLVAGEPPRQANEIGLEDGCLTPDQQLAVEAICRVVIGHRRRPLVITSDRGRGKSAALGLAAAKLIRRGVSKIVLTAPYVESVESAFGMLAAQFPQGVRHGLSFSTQFGSAHEVIFIALDELILTSPDADLVLVDEAAAIPAPMLELLLARYSRIVFASTVHGYEGTGRGFAVRFTKVLDQQAPQWRLLHIKSPIRWSEHDPFEKFVFDALLLNASPNDPPDAAQIALKKMQTRWLDQDELSQNEALLNQVFGLLVLAHYRTSPDDLRMLLDGPSLRIVAHFNGSDVVAVALIIREGRLERTLGDSIWQGRRRPRGHLIPQVLSGFAGFQEATDLLGDRVMRIAVHPMLHQLGLGAALIDEIYTKGLNDGVDYIAASFGATPELLAFWQRVGFRPLRLGLQKEAASGTHSIVMMKPISACAITLCNEAVYRFSKQFNFELGDTFSQLNVDILRKLLWLIGASEDELNERDVSDLQAFTEHQRVYESCSRVVAKLIALSATNSEFDDDCTMQEMNVLVRRVIQKNKAESVVSEFNLQGKKELDDLLRSAARKLFTRYRAAVT